MFLIQKDKYGLPSPEGAELIEQLKFNRWRNGLDTDPLPFRLVSSSEDCKLDDVPVGSVEFVSRHLACHGLSALEMDTIPEMFWREEFLRRPIRIGTLRDAESFPAEKMFIKPAIHPKLFPADIYSKASLPRARVQMRNLLVPEEECLLISGVLGEIAAEWRVFVLNGTVLDLKNYAYTNWPILPQKEFINALLSVNYDSPAYVLDVAVLESGESVLIEVHDFISIGLYGFSDSRLPTMYARAWAHYLKQQKTPRKLLN